jgi:hypothetical protein
MARCFPWPVVREPRRRLPRRPRRSRRWDGWCWWRAGVGGGRRPLAGAPAGRTARCRSEGRGGSDPVRASVPAAAGAGAGDRPGRRAVRRSERASSLDPARGCPGPGGGGRVMAGGRPVSRAPACGSRAARSSRTGGLDRHAVTGPDGRFAFPPQPPTNWFLTAPAPDLRPAIVYLELRAAQPRSSPGDQPSTRWWSSSAPAVSRPGHRAGRRRWGDRRRPRALRGGWGQRRRRGSQRRRRHYRLCRGTANGPPRPSWWQRRRLRHRRGPPPHRERVRRFPAPPAGDRRRPHRERRRAGRRRRRPGLPDGAPGSGAHAIAGSPACSDGPERRRGALRAGVAGAGQYRINFASDDALGSGRTW